MASFFDDGKRRMLPLWRCYDDTVKSRELDFTGQKLLPVRFDKFDSFTEAWAAKHTVISAADLLNAAVVSGNINRDDVRKASEFLLIHREQCSPIALDVARSIIDGDTQSVDIDPEKVSDFEELAAGLITNLDKEELRNKAQIGLLRKKLQEDCYNPIAYCELARCYANLNLDEKAKKYVDYAAFLAPHSRYVSRCAARFYIHFNEWDRARYVLIKNGFVNTDPWIMASEIAVESVMGRSSKYIKKGRQLVSSGDFSAFSCSELSFAICEVDMSAGKHKEARRMIDKGLRSPNDNSLAQVEFYAKKDTSLILDMSQYKDMSHKYEADARNAYVGGMYKDAFISSLRWMLEYRFEHRPIGFAFDISCVYLKEYGYAANILKRYLKSEPNDPSAINNMVYTLGLSNKIEEAEEYLKRINLRNYSTNNSVNAICLIATCGLLYYRKGMIDEGRKFYNDAISMAKRKQGKELAAKARLNMIREEVRASKDYNKSLLEEMNSLHTGNNAETIQLRKDIREEAEKHQKG